MRIQLFVALVPLSACATDSREAADASAVLRTSGTFAGSYEVPVDPSLRDAAVFAVEDDVDWTVSGDTVTLDYDLPPGLVGGELEITLTGTIDGDTVALSGAVGTGTCSVDGTIVVCREVFTNLGALPISAEVVESRARREYAGPVQDRVRVAQMFASEPIGIVAFDVSSPLADDDHD